MSPLPFRSRLSALTAAALLVATPALADWAADLRIKTAPPPGQMAGTEMKGKMYGRKGLLRMDLEVPAQQAEVGHMSVIFDFEKRTGTTLMHAQKLASQRSLDDLPVKLPGACTGADQDFDSCFKAQGYKKTGSAKVNGHPTTLYEGKVPGPEGKVQRQKVWLPTDLAEVPYVRSETYDAKGKVVTELDVLNVQVAPQPDSLFTVPADYEQTAPPTPGMIPGGFKPEDFQGKTPEQIQEMIRQRMNPGAKPKGP